MQQPTILNHMHAKRGLHCAGFSQRKNSSSSPLDHPATREMDFYFIRFINIQDARSPGLLRLCRVGTKNLTIRLSPPPLSLSPTGRGTSKTRQDTMTVGRLLRTKLAKIYGSWLTLPTTELHPKFMHTNFRVHTYSTGWGNP
jgi:hypothetical protein